ncbi:MAG: transporter substrate-binding domain-containing protein, partial [Planctomycetes bacterium]|nr:transporter substrate-binding domain-containing protein [Planctomycetota bacterium]
MFRLGSALLLLVCAWLTAGEAVEVLALSPEEQAWVAAHPVVRIQMSDSSPPFEFRENGRWQGLAYDCLLEASARIGLKVEVTGLSWEDSLQRISSGDGVDLLLAVTRSPERERQMLLTAGYLAFPQVIIADHHRHFISGLADLRQSTIAVERDYVMEAWLRRDLPGAHLLLSADTLPALTAVSEGRADAYVGNLALASWLIERKGLMNLGVVAPSGYGDEVFAMGVRQDWPMLVRLLDRALAGIPETRTHELRQRWLAVRYDHGLRYRDVLLWVLAAVGVSLLFIIQLRRMVRQRTAELAREVERRREGEARFRLLIDRAPEAIVLLDPHSSRFIEANPRAEAIYGVPRARILGGRPADFSPAIQPDGEPSETKAARHMAEAMAGHDQVFPWLHRHPDGTEVPCEVRLTSLPWEGRQILRCSVLDLSDRRGYESRLRRAETLANLGQLAGSVAHDFNNMLSGILGYAELLGLRLRDDKERQYVTGIADAVLQARTQTARLLAFARQGVPTSQPFNAQAAITAALDLFAASRPKGILVVRDLAAPGLLVQGYAGLLQNAV